MDLWCDLRVEQSAAVFVLLLVVVLIFEKLGKYAFDEEIRAHLEGCGNIHILKELG